MSGDRPNSVPSPWAGRILVIFFVLCALLLGLDFLRSEKHHPLEEWPILYPLFGFLGISLLILVAKGLRRLTMRSEDYYDDE